MNSVPHKIEQAEPDAEHKALLEKIKTAVEKYEESPICKFSSGPFLKCEIHNVLYDIRQKIIAEQESLLDKYLDEQAAIKNHLNDLGEQETQNNDAKKASETKKTEIQLKHSKIAEKIKVLETEAEKNKHELPQEPVVGPGDASLLAQIETAVAGPEAQQ